VSFYVEELTFIIVRTINLINNCVIKILFSPLSLLQESHSNIFTWTEFHQFSHSNFNLIGACVILSRFSIRNDWHSVLACSLPLFCK